MPSQLVSLSVLAALGIAGLHLGQSTSQELAKGQASSMVRSQVNGSKPSDPLFDIGELQFESGYAIPDKFSRRAPSLIGLKALLSEQLEDLPTPGRLPAKVKIVINAFDSAQSGDVIYSLEFQIVRKSVILGTTEVIETPVMTYSGVGRVPFNEAEKFISDQVLDMTKSFKQVYLSRISEQ